MADAVKNGDFYESGKTAILTYMGNSGSTKPPIFRTTKIPIFGDHQKAHFQDHQKSGLFWVAEKTADF